MFVSKKPFVMHNPKPNHTPPSDTAEVSPASAAATTAAGREIDTGRSGVGAGAAETKEKAKEAFKAGTVSSSLQRAESRVIYREGGFLANLGQLCMQQSHNPRM